MKYVLMLLVVLVFSMPTITFGRGLIPCGGSGEPECQACHVVQLGNKLLVWFITTMASVIVLIFAWGGMQMVMSAGNTEGVSHAKAMMTNSIVGLVILLSAWLVIDTIMKIIIKDNDSTAAAKLGVWHTISCVGQPIAPPSQVVPPTTPPTGEHLSHVTALARLTTAGVSVVSSGNCSDRTKSNCTSLDSIQESTVNKIIGVAQGCTGCNLIVTAGTETGHTNRCHVDGTCVDIKCQGDCTQSQVQQVDLSARANGARVVYETMSCSARDTARSQGITAYCQSDPGYGHITGNHFSLYTQ